MPMKIKDIMIISGYKIVFSKDLHRFENKKSINVKSIYDELLKQFPVKVSSKMKL